MASISRIGNSWRALVRKGGHSRCQTFATQAAAKAWARMVETEIEELKSTGRMQPRGTTVGASSTTSSGMREPGTGGVGISSQAGSNGLREPQSLSLTHDHHVHADRAAHETAAPRQ